MKEMWQINKNPIADLTQKNTIKLFLKIKSKGLNSLLGLNTISLTSELSKVDFDLSWIINLLSINFYLVLFAWRQSSRGRWQVFSDDGSSGKFRVATLDAVTRQLGVAELESRDAVMHEVRGGAAQRLLHSTIAGIRVWQIVSWNALMHLRFLGGRYCYC
jgi:hypothetical protein